MQQETETPAALGRMAARFTYERDGRYAARYPSLATWVWASARAKRDGFELDHSEFLGAYREALHQCLMAEV